MINKNCIYFIFFFSVVQIAYTQNFNQRDSLTILADSLYNDGAYKKALVVRKQVLKNLDHFSNDYTLYVKSKYYHTKSSYFDSKNKILETYQEKHLDSALQYAFKARDIYSPVKNPDKLFLFEIQNSIYHLYYSQEKWKQSLKEAQFAYHILKDTLSENDIKFVDLIFDIGNIYSWLGDYSEAIEYYQKSLDLYKIVLGENKPEVALAYNNISVEYRNLGLKKKEFNALLKAISIWENLNDEKYSKDLYSCYGNLFYWYSGYGDVEKAEEYFLKQDKLRTEELKKKERFIRNNEEVYKAELRNWYNHMIYSKVKKDTLGAISYIQKILKATDKPSGLYNFEVSLRSSALLHYAALVNRKDYTKALDLLTKTINLQKQYKEKYFTNPLSYQFKKADLLIRNKKYEELDSLLDYLIEEAKKRQLPVLFHMYILKGKTSEALGNKSIAKEYFDKALMLSLADKSGSLKNVQISDFNTIISYERINGFIEMGDFYLNRFKQNNNITDLDKAFNRYLLSSKLYNQLYLGKRYNEKLFKYLSRINNGLLNCAIRSDSKKGYNEKIINEIENNGSKLAWSKFMYNNQKKNLNLPKQLLEREEELKAQLNFYKKKLYGTKNIKNDKKNLWEQKLIALEKEFSVLQDTLKQKYTNYYDFNYYRFDIDQLKGGLEKNTVILKYVLAEKQLYAFAISKNNLELYSLGDQDYFQEIMNNLLKRIKSLDFGYAKDLDLLKKNLIEQFPTNNYDKVVVIPDGFLFYMPFELFSLPENNQTISYSPSLLLYKTQMEMNSKIKRINLAAFSASSSNDSANFTELNYADNEIERIVDIFDGEVFTNSSKKLFLEQAEQFDVLHLAMHSTINEEEPELTSINFYQGEQNRLSVSELYNVSLDADMVVLSSCNTGNGIYESGEGVISLSRAFTFSGVSSTIMSLWKVPDKESAIIMKSFYQYLKLGLRKDKALLKAKLDYINNTDDDLLKHPYFWAGFVVSGNISPIISKPSIFLKDYFLLTIFGIFTVIIILIFYKKSIHFF